MNRLLETFCGIVEDWFSARTVFAAMFYGTACYMWVHQIELPAVLVTIISTLTAHFVITYNNGKDAEPAK